MKNNVLTKLNNQFKGIYKKNQSPANSNKTDLKSTELYDNGKFFLFKRIFKFSLIQLFNCKVSIALFITLILSQPLILTIVYSIGLNLINNSLLFILVPLGISFLFIVAASIRLFNENRFNYIDSILIVKPVRRQTILFARVGVIIGLIFACMLFYTIYALILLLAINQNSLFLGIFVANTFISPLINLIILSFIILISIKVKLTWFASSSLLLSILMAFPSLITRPLFPDNNMPITYQNADISFSKLYLANSNQTYLTTDVKNSDYIYTTPNEYFGNPNIGNYFIPSEWLVSFYSSLFAGLQYNDPTTYTNDSYSLVNKKFQAVNVDDLNVDINEAYMFRPHDIIPFELTTIEYEKLIMQNLANIIAAKDVIDFNQSYVLGNFMTKLNSSIIWNNLQLNEKELNSLKLLFGIDTDYNQMYYLYKYYPTLINHLPNLKTLVTETYITDMWNLLELLWTSDNAKLNINNDDVFSSNLKITDLYGDGSVYKDSKPIQKYDASFIRDDLIRYNGMAVSYYTTTGNYASTNLADVLKAYDSTIVDEASWITFADNIALQYADTTAFIDYLVDELPQVYKLNISKNWINLYKFSSFLEIKQTPYLIISDILIVLICLASPALFWWTIRRFKLGQYNDI